MLLCWGRLYRRLIQEAREKHVGKAEGGELCAQGLGFLTHAGTKRGPPPTGRLRGRLSRRGAAGAAWIRAAALAPGECWSSGQSEITELGFPILVPAVPRLSDLLKTRARSRSAGARKRQLSAVPPKRQRSPPRAVKNNGQGADKAWAIEPFPCPSRLNIIIPTLQMDCISSAEIWKE